MNENELTKEIRSLRKIISKLEKQQRLPLSFTRGIATGLGSVIGATFVVALLLYFLRNIEFIPLIGTWLAQIIEHVEFITSNK